MTIKKKTIFLIFVALLVFHKKTIAQDKEKIFTIYLVRHSEKDLSSKSSSNPKLTNCGKLRAKNLENFLRDTNIDAVYSTDYIRTVNTAIPTAVSKGLGITNYDSKDLVLFSKKLISLKQDALVVGHSNTTGVLAGLLVGEKIGEFDLSEYDRIYQVVIYRNSAKLNLQRSDFVCKN